MAFKADILLHLANNLCSLNLQFFALFLLLFLLTSRESNPCPRNTPVNFLQAYLFFFSKTAFKITNGLFACVKSFLPAFLANFTERQPFSLNHAASNGTIHMA